MQAREDAVGVKADVRVGPQVEVGFHAGWTLHRAGPNPTAQMRPAMTVIYFADGTRVCEPESIYQEFDLAVWLPGLRTGDVAASSVNPLLWPIDGDPQPLPS